jgi:hypothetical protein
LAIAGKFIVFYQDLLKKLSQKTLGSDAVDAMIAKDGNVTFKRYHKYRRRLKKLNREFGLRKKQVQTLHRACADHIQTVNSPLALISQIQRSGGSLLSQLFDGHPELHAHPHELKIGYPRKYIWPKLNLNDPPEKWFVRLFERSVLDHLKNGYKKQKNLDETFLFSFLPSVQRELFLNYLETIDTIKLRDVFDAYMTSYFGAWLNNQNSFGPKKYITAFTARLSMEKKNMEAFFGIYPDGRLISLIRDPKNWYPSAARHRPLVYGDIKTALELWQKSAQAILWNKERYGDRVCILTFEDLVGKSGSVMHYLADFLEIKFDDILLIPTFNKFPIKANTSFNAKHHGIIDTTLNRYKTLSEEQLDIINQMSADLHRQVLDLAVRF